jgi:protein-L-isoaspartate(D-aspartate) O-methyltransferase
MRHPWHTSGTEASSPAAAHASADAQANELEQRRLVMVMDQLQRRGIEDGRVLAAMRQVPRHAFVAASQVPQAYEDRPLEIGHGQTISQPFTVAFMAQALQLQGDEKVLEIGTGSGYGAAVLGQLAAQVHTVERWPELAAAAQERLAELGYANVQVHHRDGTLGLPELAPFDAIVVTAGAPQLPAAYLSQLSDSGRLVIPIDQPPHQQAMYRFQRRGDNHVREFLGSFMFVPLVSGVC